MDAIIVRVAETLGLNENELINMSLKEYLKHELLQCDAELHKLTIKYDVKSAREMEERYIKGEIAEEGTWEDFFKIDHLEAKKEELLMALKELE